MIWLPKNLEVYKKEALKWLNGGAIKALEFSGRTYQVNVYDPEAKEAYWAFLHLDEKGGIADSFCLCSEENERPGCPHIAASFIKIYNGHLEPLHIRYEKSFYRELFLSIDERVGSNPQVLKKNKYISFKAHNKAGEQFLKELIQKGVPPTEENSLKFSDLTEDELAQIKHGHLTPKIHYEFSFWSDLAKSLLLQHENGVAPSIIFSGDPIPLDLKVDTKDFEFHYRLTEKELNRLIPKLNQVDSNLKLFGDFSSQVEKVHFDAKEKTLHLDLKNKETSFKSHKKFHDYYFEKGKGFINPERLEMIKPVVTDVGAFLDKYQQDLSEFIQIDPSPSHLHTDIKIERGTLHTTPYFQKSGDLEEGEIFGNWLYINGKFKRIIDAPPHLKGAKIARDKVYDYVMTHQAYLNGLEGFKVHLQPIETVLSYKVDERHSLTLESSMKSTPLPASYEFGSLIYVKGQGFFSKSSFETNLPLNTPIKEHEVASFIRKNERELKLVPGFFLERPPIEQASLDIYPVNEGIEVIPRYQWEEEFKNKKYHFFDDYIYIENQGFFPYSPRHFLPNAYRAPTIIHESEYPKFFGETLKTLAPYISTKDDTLAYPKNITFSFSSLDWDDTAKSYKGELLVNGIPIPTKEKRFHFTKAGLIDIELEPLKLVLKDIAKNRPYFSSLDILKLLALTDVKIDLPVLKEFQELKPSKLIHHEALRSVLRPYQEVGVNWLWFLYTHRLSGLLSDDMGLGKTHQAMGLMASIQTYKKDSKFLVVCPTSVLHHWEDKLKLYFPTLTHFTFHGLKRDFSQMAKADLVITSYGILRNEIEKFKTIPFELAVFDEIQLAKNHLSRIHLSLKQIKASTRVGLTGTPLENRLRELKALFDIVLPGLMPSEQVYIESFVKPIEKGENLEAKASLSRLIKPFLLRRKKEDVLTDLPEKIEEISHADLLPDQVNLYHNLIAEAKRGAVRDLYDDNKVIPYIHIFALLSNLKKICNHPALFLKEPSNYEQYSSGKWELFKELLEEALASEQKVVVFSHFLGMLDIIESYLTSIGVGFASLRGSTINRKEEIGRFQNDPNCKVFVASLQAGGLGIDLTQASVVIHYDRWWNAARENQATDRVHRIGQTRGVQVFKLVTLNSVEERIHEMIEKKARRMEEIVGADDSQVIKTLSRDELIELLRDAET